MSLPAITARLIISRLDIPMTTRPRPGLRAAAKNCAMAARAHAKKNPAPVGRAGFFLVRALRPRGSGQRLGLKARRAGWPSRAAKPRGPPAPPGPP